MRKLFIFLLFLAIPLLSADLFNIGTIINGNVSGVPPSSGDFLAYYDTPNSVTYIFRFTYVDSSDSYHSPPIYIGDCNATAGFIRAKQSATGDANVILHYAADDRNTWETVTPAALDAVSNSEKATTLTGQQFTNGRWLVIECAGGGANNQDGNVMTVTVELLKDMDNTLTANGKVIRCAKVARIANTNP